MNTRYMIHRDIKELTVLWNYDNNNINSLSASCVQKSVCTPCFWQTKKWGGHLICCPPLEKKWGGQVPPVPHRSTPMCRTMSILVISYKICAIWNFVVSYKICTMSKFVDFCRPVQNLRKVWWQYSHFQESYIKK